MEHPFKKTHTWPLLVHFYAGKYIFWYKGTLKTQYGLVHKFARYKQFYKHMIILKNVNNCDITYKTDFHFFLNNTGFVGIKAVVSSSFSEDTPDDWKPTVWISHQLGWGTGQGHSRNSPSHPLKWGIKRTNQSPRTKPETSETRMASREEHKWQDQQSRRLSS